MSIAGKAFIATFNDVVPDGRENLYEWHNREHMPERLGVPGFRRGRRFSARRGGPEYFIFYELEDVSVGGSDAYLARLNDPTPWTKTSQKNFRNSSRSICRVPLSLGAGMGGFALAMRFEADDPERLERSLVEDILPPIAPMVGIAGVHLGICDPAVSGIETTEKKGRATFAMPGWLLIVEGVSEETLDRVLTTRLEDSRLEKAGARGPFESGIYQMEFCLAN